MFELKKVIKKYGKHVVLNEVDFKVEQGETVALTGPSGSGKSTLINLLIGAIKPEGGHITVNHKRVEGLTGDDLQMYRRSLGVVFQDYKLLPRKTVFENVAFALEICEYPEDQIDRKVMKAIEMVGLMGKETQFPNELSGGEQQRVAIARAIVHEPKFIFADEPTGNLDTKTAQDITALLKKINQELNTTTLITTHNLEVIKWMGCRQVEIKNGKVWETVGDNVQFTQDIIDED